MGQIQHRSSSLKCGWDIEHLFTNLRMCDEGAGIWERFLQQHKCWWWETISHPSWSPYTKTLEVISGKTVYLSCYLSQPVLPHALLWFHPIQHDPLCRHHFKVAPAMTNLASNPSRDQCHSKVTPALGKGEDNYINQCTHSLSNLSSQTS